MSKIQELEDQIEQLRIKMYNSYADNPYGTQVLKFSRELDHLLNQLNKESNISLND
ncbi:aspartyl-phosphate phosphatase Spo0E family protein [Halobacillus campisalis]|uniref:Spo0E family sporulation regulatory protein-aspartic acid phosphatase n=1 Tax=Halobacillus campisalis TaxID=435909 RepID=A0ABW2K718_9BACI|nr:aspartyl-phosphate phosphatase Spo0E family protein [Halobacillus campisalis]